MMQRNRTYICDLTAEEEKKLFRRWHDYEDDDADVAAEQLIVANERLIEKIANENKDSLLSKGELIDELCLGLLKAVACYRPDIDMEYEEFKERFLRVYIFRYRRDYMNTFNEAIKTMLRRNADFTETEFKNDSDEDDCKFS